MIHGYRLERCCLDQGSESALEVALVSLIADVALQREERFGQQFPLVHRVDEDLELPAFTERAELGDEAAESSLLESHARALLKAFDELLVHLEFCGPAQPDLEHHGQPLLGRSLACRELFPGGLAFLRYESQPLIDDRAEGVFPRLESNGFFDDTQLHGAVFPVIESTQCFGFALVEVVPVRVSLQAVQPLAFEVAAAEEHVVFAEEVEVSLEFEVFLFSVERCEFVRVEGQRVEASGEPGAAEELVCALLGEALDGLFVSVLFERDEGFLEQRERQGVLERSLRDHFVAPVREEPLEHQLVQSSVGLLDLARVESVGDAGQLVDLKCLGRPHARLLQWSHEVFKFGSARLGHVELQQASLFAGVNVDVSIFVFGFRPVSGSILRRCRFVLRSGDEGDEVLHGLVG